MQEKDAAAGGQALPGHAGVPGAVGGYVVSPAGGAQAAPPAPYGTPAAANYSPGQGAGYAPSPGAPVSPQQGAVQYQQSPPQAGVPLAAVGGYQGPVAAQPAGDVAVSYEAASVSASHDGTHVANMQPVAAQA